MSLCCPVRTKNGHGMNVENNSLYINFTFFPVSLQRNMRGGRRFVAIPHTCSTIPHLYAMFIFLSHVGLNAYLSVEQLY